jgi:uncharacterized membrane protein YhaH (DUF805 family)
MSFTEAIKACKAKYAVFDGRATRSEFWWFYLFTVIVIFVAYLVPFILIVLASAFSDNFLGTIFSLLAMLGYLLVFVIAIGLYIPLLAAGSRRLHDRGQSGWLQLLLLVPCASLVLLVFWALEGTPGDNQYGPSPT